MAFENWWTELLNENLKGGLNYENNRNEQPEPVSSTSVPY